jgi:hypothetical protein
MTRCYPPSSKALGIRGHQRLRQFALARSPCERNMKPTRVRRCMKTPRGVSRCRPRRLWCTPRKTSWPSACRCHLSGHTCRPSLCNQFSGRRYSRCDASRKFSLPERAWAARFARRARASAPWSAVRRPPRVPCANEFGAVIPAASANARLPKTIRFICISLPFPLSNFEHTAGNLHRFVIAVKNILGSPAIVC